MNHDDYILIGGVILHRSLKYAERDALRRKACRLGVPGAWTMGRTKLEGQLRSMIHLVDISAALTDGAS